MFRFEASKEVFENNSFENIVFTKSYSILRAEAY